MKLKLYCYYETRRINIIFFNLFSLIAMILYSYVSSGAMENQSKLYIVLFTKYLCVDILYFFISFYVLFVISKSLLFVVI